MTCGSKDSKSPDYRRVRSILLPFHGLEGYLTPLSSLTEIHSFSVNGNKISGSIPQSFFNMPKLQSLYLNENQLTGSIPSIASFKSPLIYAYLNNNRLKGTIPESLSMLTGLQTLQLGDNLLTGTIPSTLRDISSLYQLFLAHNLLSGTIPVLDQSSLQGIDLSANYLTMGSLKEVPLSTFKESGGDMGFYLNLESNCLVFRNPIRPSQNVEATHCKGKQLH